MRIRQLTTTLALTILSAARSAAADSAADARVAQGLFDEARMLMDQKRFVEACPKLAESQRLDPGGGTLLNLAVCHGGEGKLATALVEYHDALRAAVRDGRKDREDIARASIAALEKDVPRLTVTVAQPPPDLEVKVDQTSLPRGAWGAPMPVDPGSHTIVTVSRGVTTTVEVDIVAGERKTVEATITPPTGSGTSSAAPSLSANTPQSRTNTMFWVVFGTTLGASAVSLTAGALSLLDWKKSEDGCIKERNYCWTAEARDAHDSARTFAWISTVSLGVAAVGTVVLLFAPFRSRASAPSAASIGLRGTGLGGSF